MEPSPSTFGGVCHAEAQCMVNYKYLDSKRAVCIPACYMNLRLSFCICRSNQIASNSVYRWRGPIPIDLFSSLIFMPSITEI